MSAPGDPAPGRRAGAEPRPGGRCAVHPARPDVDRCPVCDRRRCGVCAAESPGGGCRGCRGAVLAGTGRAPGALERGVRAALAAHAAALLGGVVASEYVGAEVFAYLTPLVVGVVCGAAAAAAAGGGREGTTPAVRVVAVVYSLVAVALGFVLEGSEDLLSTGAVLPYAAAVTGAVLWTLPPQRSAVRGGGRA